MEIIKFLQTFSNPFLDVFFQLVTMLGEESIYIIFLGIVYWCYNKKFGYKLAFAFLSSTVINGAIKNIFKFPRPIGVEGIKSLRVETATGFSFPSGHAQGTAAFWTSVALYRKSAMLYGLGAAMMILVAVSRLYLGVHWPLDVLGGIVFGILSVIIANWIFELSEKKKDKTILLSLVIPSLIGLLFFGGAEDYVKAAAVVCSFYIGYVIEDRYIRFIEYSESWKQVLKFLIGIAGILIIKVFVKELLPYTSLGYFIRYFMIGIWTTVCAPYLFKVFKLSSNKISIRNIAA